VLRPNIERPSLVMPHTPKSDDREALAQLRIVKVALIAVSSDQAHDHGAVGTDCVRFRVSVEVEEQHGVATHPFCASKCVATEAATTTIEPSALAALGIQEGSPSGMGRNSTAGALSLGASMACPHPPISKPPISKPPISKLQPSPTPA
jgi:hypothetical protein